MADLGYYTTNSLLCLETIGPLVIFYVFKVIIFLILKVIQKFTRCKDNAKFSSFM